DDYEVVGWILIKQAQLVGLTEEKINKWNLCYKEEKLWRSKNRLESSELEVANIQSTFQDIIK
ncbi:hypothetical protein WUBG_12612, partial [Wuchereria bancrofti]